MVLEQRFGLIVAREACTVVFVPGRYTSQRRDDDLDRARTTNPALPELSLTHAPRFTFRNFFDDDLDLAIFFLFFFGKQKKKMDLLERLDRIEPMVGSDLVPCLTRAVDHSVKNDDVRRSLLLLCEPKSPIPLVRPCVDVVISYLERKIAQQEKKTPAV